MIQATLSASSLLQAIASYDGHIVGASRTGSGKTTIMLAAIAQLYHKTNGGAEFFCASGKASIWMGLEGQTASDKFSRVLNASLSNPNSIEPILQRLRWAVATQEKREELRLAQTLQGKKPNPRPFYFILDEWLIILKVAKKHSKATYQELIDLVECLIFKGRQDKCYLWLFAQGHQCGTLNLDKDCRRNLGVIALGGAGDYESVTAAIADSDLVSSPNDRDRLQLQYQALVAENPTGRIYYSSIGGHKVARADTLPDMEQERLFQADAGQPEITEPTVTQAREKLEDLYQKSQSPEPVELPTNHQTEELKIRAKELTCKEQELRLKYSQYADSKEVTEARWNLFTLSIGVAVFTIYVFPPFSGALQAAWKGAVKVGETVAAVAIGANNAANYWAPDLQKTPSIGDKISGYKVTSVYGPRKAPVGGASTYHGGVDLATPAGTKLYAIANPSEEIVVKCWKDSRGGGNVATFHSMGWKFQYLHLNRCSSGKHKAGAVIAESGNTGVGSGAHLHFEQIKLTGEKIPPQTGYVWWVLTGSKPQPVVTQGKNK